MEMNEESSKSDKEHLTSRPPQLERHRKSEHTGTIIFVAGVAFLAAIIGCLLFFLVLRGGPRIPDLIGFSYKRAKEKAVDSNFSIEIDPTQDAEAQGVDKLKVEEQDPKPGVRAEKGELITVKLKGLHEAPQIEDLRGTDTSPGSIENTEESGSSGGNEQANQSRSRSVCIDPGHSGNCPSSEIDPTTGLDVADNSGASGERKAMWDLALRLKAKLEGAGYTVRLTKDSPDAYSSLRARADIGNTCEIMVRLHFDPNLQAVLYPGEGQYKSHGGNTVVVDPSVARSSAALAEVMFPYLKTVGITKKMNDTGGTSNDKGPAFVISVLSRVPVVLIENEPSLVSGNASGQEQVSEAIFRGICAYFQTH
ncbi:MAG: N-acetylmuramoyl-L-alanine amidase [Actinomycetota bacterium]|nr:N-acetylmuramoyl-L-alanine amidase [Actinomycetota bacterium]